LDLGALDTGRAESAGKLDAVAFFRFLERHGLVELRPVKTKAKLAVKD
jgi:hypothetical protein